jgi:hypothetical protein
VVAENELRGDSDIRLSGREGRYRDLELYNNRKNGACWSDNACGGQMLMFGRTILSAGLLAVLFWPGRRAAVLG